MRSTSGQRLLARSATVTTAAAAMAVIAFAAARCGSSGTTTTVSSAYEDPYLYTYYYPADVAYGSAYWAYDWPYTYVYATASRDYGPVAVPPGTGGAIGATGTGGVTGADAGASGAPATTIGDLLRGLARGDATICAGHVSVTQKTAPPPCSGGAQTAVRAGVTVAFDACPLANGATVGGSIDVTATQTASEATCGPSTTITLSHTTTITNLSYTGASGAKVVIPSQTDTGTNTFTIGQAPDHLVISSNGQLQVFTADGTMAAALAQRGDHTFSFNGSTTSYTIDGTVNVTDNMGSGATATLTSTGLTRDKACCRPVGGTLQVVRTGGSSPATHTWTFGPSCGAATVDGNTATLPACI